MEIKDFILQPEEHEEATPVATKKKTSKPSITYRTLAENEMDFVLERKSSRITAIMAVIPSKGQYYITKTEKKDGQEVETKLDFYPNNIAWFTQGLTEPYEINNAWLNEFEKGTLFAGDLIGFLKRNESLVRAGLLRFGENLSTGMQYVYGENPKLAVYLTKIKNTLPKTPPIICRWSSYQPFAIGAFEENRQDIGYLLLFEKIFGIDATRTFVEAFVERNINFGCDTQYFAALINTFYEAMAGKPLLVEARTSNRCGYCYPSYIVDGSLVSKHNRVRIDPKAFLEYALTYQREGFETLSNFVQILADDWRMQKDLSDTISEKYPKNLATHHNALAVKQRFVSSEIDKKKFTAYYKAQKHLEWSDDTYSIIVPETVNDMIEEAIQQNNCLRTYIGSVLEGQTSIFFLRKKKFPDESLVTIEVTRGELVQAKAKYNRAPGQAEMDAIRRWCDAKKITA